MAAAKNLLFVCSRNKIRSLTAEKLLKDVPGRGWLLWLYQHVPAFAPLSEGFYALVAAHRNFFYWVTRLLWGRDIGPHRYTLSRWEGLTRFLDDGCIEIDSNVVERSIRAIALNRKNALFAGSDGGAEHWAVIASLIETCKLNGVEPLGYLADVLTRIVNGHPNSQIDELLPWAYIRAPELKAVA